MLCSLCSFPTFPTPLLPLFSLLPPHLPPPLCAHCCAFAIRFVVLVSLAPFRPVFPLRNGARDTLVLSPTYIQGILIPTHQSAVLGGSVSSPPFPPYVPNQPLRLTLHNWIRHHLLSRGGLGACFCQTSLLPELSGSSSQNSREGPSYADLQAPRFGGLGTGVYAPVP